MSYLTALAQYLHARLVVAERGQTLAEYGILVAVIAIVAILAVVLLGGSVSTLFSSNAGRV